MRTMRSYEWEVSEPMLERGMQTLVVAVGTQHYVRSI